MRKCSEAFSFDIAIAGVVVSGLIFAFVFYSIKHIHRYKPAERASVSQSHYSKEYQQKHQIPYLPEATRMISSDAFRDSLVDGSASD